MLQTVLELVGAEWKKPRLWKQINHHVDNRKNPTWHRDLDVGGGGGKTEVEVRAWSRPRPFGSVLRGKRDWIRAHTYTYGPRHPGILSWVVWWLTGAIVQSRTTGEWMNKIVCVFFRFSNNNRRGGGESVARRGWNESWEPPPLRMSERREERCATWFLFMVIFSPFPSFLVCVAWRELSLLPLHSSVTLYGLMRSIKSMYWLMRREKKLTSNWLCPRSRKVS